MRSWLDGSIQYLDLSRILAQFLPILSKTWGVAWKNQITCHALDDVDWSREAFISRYGPTMGNLRYLMNRSNLLDDGEGATSRWCTKICARKDSGEFFGRCWVSFSKFKTRLPYHFGQTVKSKTTIYKVWCLLLDTTKRWGETNTRWCLFANHFENKYAHQVGNHFPKFLGKQFQKSLKPPARLPWYRWVQRKSQSKFYETHPDSSSIIHKAPKHPVIPLGC